MKILDSHRKTLMESGRWKEFTLYRETLRDFGQGPSESHRNAIREFLGDAAESEYGSAKVGAPAKRVSKVEKPEIKEQSRRGATQTHRRDPGDLIEPVSRDRFTNLDPSIKPSEIIWWVANNCDIADIGPEDCPSVVAWSMLNHIRSSLQARNDFFKTTLPKIIPPKPLDQSDEDIKTKDGEHVISALDKILAASERARDPSVVGD